MTVRGDVASGASGAGASEGRYRPGVTPSRALPGGASREAKRGARAASADASLLLIALVSPRPRTRLVVRRAFPRRMARVVSVRSAGDLRNVLRAELVDGVIVDLGGASSEGLSAMECARDFPAHPFFAAMPLWPADAATAARCVAMEAADLLVEGADDPAVREIVSPSLFSTRFARALADPPPQLRLESQLQWDAWQGIVRRAGRPLRTEALAQELKVTREHLSRRFSENGAPTLKRVIDLVRVLAAAELLKNPGHDVGAVASALGFASSSHLSTTSRRVADVRPSSLSRLRGVDLIGRFAEAEGRGESASLRSR